MKSGDGVRVGLCSGASVPRRHPVLRSRCRPVLTSPTVVRARAPSGAGSAHSIELGTSKEGVEWNAVDDQPGPPGVLIATPRGDDDAQLGILDHNAYFAAREERPELTVAEVSA